MRTDQRHRSTAAHLGALLGLAAASVPLLLPASSPAQATERAARTGTGTGGAQVRDGGRDLRLDPDRVGKQGRAAHEPAARGRLWVGVARPDGSGGTRRDWVLLTCDPDGGTHPRAVEACDALRAVHGDPGAQGLRAGMCPTMYQPVTVAAVGRWNGVAVRYRETFDNACVMRSMTGPVFDITGA